MFGSSLQGLLFITTNPNIVMEQKRYPKGHFIGLGIALGTPIGIPLWLVTDNPGMIGTGIAIGVAIGAALEEKYNRNPRPPTTQEKKNRKMAVISGAVLVLMGIIALLIMMF